MRAMRRLRHLNLAAAVLVLAAICLLAASPGAAPDACFPETGKCVSRRFYDYWLANGGLAQHGYPISDEADEVNPADGGTYRVQYFERARFEHHPELAGTRHEVQLGLLGREQFLARYPGGSPPAIPEREGDRCILDAALNCLVRTRGNFAEYWMLNGGLARHGYPISPVFSEVNPTDGRVYEVQYFERSRFEFHPDNAEPYRTLLGLLGREQYLARPR